MTEAPDATENKKLFENQEVLAASEKIITRGHERMCLRSKKCRRSNMKVHFFNEISSYDYENFFQVRPLIFKKLY